MLKNFARIPSAWIRQRGLADFGLSDVPSLKTLFGLAILRGKYERTHEQAVTWFPASLTELSDAAHLSRNDALDGLRGLLGRRIMERRHSAGAVVGAHPRTSAFQFAGAPRPYIPFPHFHVERSEFLAGLRRDQASLAALKTYLLLCTFRSGETKTAALGYNKLEFYGVRRTYIRHGLSLLYSYGLVLRVAPTADRLDPRYVIQGLERPEAEAADAPAAAEAASS